MALTKRKRLKKTSKKTKKTAKKQKNPSPTPTPLTVWDPRVQKRLKTLIAEFIPKNSVFGNQDVAQEIMVTALKAVQSQIGRLDLKILSRSIRELRYAFKIFKTYRNVPKVTIFGSARTKPSEMAYKIARQFARDITDKGFMVITGAGPGIMEAGNYGARPGKSFGVNIKLPFEQSANKYIANEPTYIDCRYFFTRKLVFVKETNAVAVFPGGFGTLDEAFEILTLVQTGKSDPLPIVFVDSPGGSLWKTMDKALVRKLLQSKKISKEDTHLYKIVYSSNQAIEEILHFYSNYHSIRYVRDILVLRFQNPITDQQLHYVNKNFKDLLKSGHFIRSGPLPDEANQPEIAFLPRLIGKFNRVNNGRLRLLIDYMNKPNR